MGPDHPKQIACMPPPRSDSLRFLPTATALGMMNHGQFSLLVPLTESAARLSGDREGLVEVGQEVVDVLDAHRQAHGVQAHASLVEFFRIQLTVRGGGRVRGQ